jgi:hypothetical protein
VGDEHPDVAVSLNNWRNSTVLKEDTAKPTPVSTSFALRRRLLGENIPMLPLPQQHALLYESQGRYIQAEALHQKLCN